ncbi:hypothetical protein [Brachybacterium hainanense]|uniref:Uncharacterized protein n=1 Tax=Brachybacterium hainanense TaxID=1541174 RepID=A0ABV6R7M2_9MICO
MTPRTAPIPSSSSVAPAPALRRSGALAAGGAVLAGTASLLAQLAGPGADYALVFPPPWLAGIGSLVLAAAVLLSRRRRPLASAAAWTAAVLLLGGSGGAVLDAFRGFFAVTGIPAGSFALLDVSGAIARTASLAAVFCAIGLGRALRRARRTSDARGAGHRRAMRLLRAAGLLACVPYPLLKLVWWASGEAGAPLMELLLFGIAAGGVLVLTAARDGARPARLVAACGWIGSLALLSMGALMVFGLLAQVTGVAAAPVAFEGGGRTGIVLGVYTTWLALGVIVAAATVLYEESDPSAAEPDAAALAR